MTARSPAQRYWLRAAGALCGAGLLSGLSPGCYPSGGAGTQPPPNAFYYPVGLAVSTGGNVLYAVNSDFDLQWNGGTLQSYDLFRLRHDTAQLINANFAPPGTDAGLNIAFLGPWPGAGECMSPLLVADAPTNSNGSRIALGQSCSPPVNANQYIRKSAIIGAFATDLQLSRDGTRLFAPVRGDGTVTWADVLPDTQSPLEVPPEDLGIAAPCVDGGAAPCVSAWTTNTASTGATAPDQFDCGSGPDQRCDSRHHTGAVPDPADTRLVTLPGEPFALGQTIDGTALVVTHQTTDETSLLLSGLNPELSSEMDPPSTADGGASSGVDAGAPAAPSPVDPSMQFVLTGVPIGGDGIVAVPHDPDAPVPPCELVASSVPCVNPAFLETTHNVAEIDLLRYYNDDGSSVKRPFLVREAAYTLTANIGGTDSRDIVIDATPRQACKFHNLGSLAECAQRPARVFFASRTPPALVFGEIGQSSESGSVGYDPDRLVITGNQPIANGGSRVYLAPIVDRTGHYALRVFVVCFDANQIFVWDPNAEILENIINVAPGPFAMAFDPFDMDAVADQAAVEADPRQDPTLNLKRYRFAYVASFTQSFVQVIDLDDSIEASSNTTFEQVVFTLGQPTFPKGS
ncbi:MAG TPA: hypothetical protein VK841_15520 [Polyangiaceae bacterium]|nr:hypothetical protein [Polyangiaceae bacterium]